MSSSNSTCTIIENPDIAGVGVRFSMYLPALLASLNSGYITAKIFVKMFNAVLPEMVTDVFGEDQLESKSIASEAHSSRRSARSSSASIISGDSAGSRSNSGKNAQTEEDEEQLEKYLKYLEYLEDNPHYFESAKALERSLFLVGSAIVASAILDGAFITSDTGLSPYHALIVLNLTLLNNMAGAGFALFRMGAVVAKMETRDRKQEQSKLVSWTIQFFDVFGLGFIQMVMILGFGLWFWISATFLHTFSGYMMTDGGSNQESECVTKTLYWVFHQIRVEASLSIKIISLIFYLGTPLVPLLGPANLIVPSLIIIRMIPLAAGTLVSTTIYLFGVAFPRIAMHMYHRRTHRFTTTSAGEHDAILAFFPTLEPSTTSYRLIMLVFVVANSTPIFFLVISTEKTISMNSQAGTVVSNGSSWTYGQTLASFTAVIGVLMYGAEVVGNWRRVIKKRREEVASVVESEEDEESAIGLSGTANERCRRRAYSV
ncbi:hypothetical protein BDP27DRAFT_1447289 [Rhodocollybia butyracea]|uniref:Transmembrane protein n=1 Tax=Rhodocollybia butyracea TaxID=206335 RepID=A0A9P5U8L2_9AGAR|nr:hypothetical protein BDP27DRAFT_1447289 [Rhodocollybia butyracea]